MNNTKKILIIIASSIIAIAIIVTTLVFVNKYKQRLAEERKVEFVNGSKIESIELTEQKIEDLKVLGLIWGFLKYYHPSIAEGKYNWDFELFRIMPKILNAKNTQQRDKYLTKWIKSLGKYEIDEPKNFAKKLDGIDVKMKPDLAWIENSNFSESLTKELINVKNAKRTGKNHYVDFTFTEVPHNFKNEDLYIYRDRYPDTGYRLLSLYRYWNYVQYFFAYKYLIGEDWKDVLSEFIPKFINAKDKLDYQLTVQEICARLNDSHAQVYSNNIQEYWGNMTVPIKTTFINKELIVSGYYDDISSPKNGLKRGDKIIKIDNKSIPQIIKEKSKYISASNDNRKLDFLSQKILNTNNDKIKIEFIRDDKKYIKELKAEIPASKYYDSNISHKILLFKMLTNEVAYINALHLTKQNFPKIRTEIDKSKALIIDLRCYPNFEVLPLLADYLYPKKTEFYKIAKPNVETPGLFLFHDGQKYGFDNKDYYKGRVIALVSQKTQSLPEFICMALQQAPRTIVVGNTTSAADGDITRFKLPGSIQTQFTAFGIYYPDRSETQRVGVKIDVLVKPTIEGIINRRDEILDKALEIIETETE